MNYLREDEKENKKNWRLKKKKLANKYGIQKIEINIKKGKIDSNIQVEQKIS